MALLPKPSVVLKQLQKTKRISRSRLVISQGDRLDLHHLEAVAENIGEENIRNKCIIDMLPGLGLWSHVLLQYQPQHIYAVEKETQFDSYLQALCREYPDKFSLPHGRYCQEYLSQIRQKPSELAEFPSMAHTGKLNFVVFNIYMFHFSKPSKTPGVHPGAIRHWSWTSVQLILTAMRLTLSMDRSTSHITSSYNGTLSLPEPSSLMLTGALKAEKTHYSWLFHMVADSLDQANLYEYGRVQMNIFLPEDFVKVNASVEIRQRPLALLQFTPHVNPRISVSSAEFLTVLQRFHQRLRQPVSTAIKALGKDSDYVLRTSAVNPDQLVAQLTLDDINRICMASAADY
ncbi:hypothetical protein IWQ61_007498 [Dispira simplex]|nr:hypothetical protein IWQ61_007498 [Dispira simplex]